MLSKKTQYAFKALTYMAERKKEGPLLISEISKKKKIPLKFLENILLELKKAGLLESKKGKGGGYFLVKNPTEVNLMQVMRLIDGPIALLPCVSLNYYEHCDECRNEKTCGIRDSLIAVRDETLNILKQSTLAKIVKRERQLGHK